MNLVPDAIIASEVSTSLNGIRLYICLDFDEAIAKEI
jgi:hypothetical protein